LKYKFGGMSNIAINVHLALKYKPGGMSNIAYKCSPSVKKFKIKKGSSFSFRFSNSKKNIKYFYDVRKKGEKKFAIDRVYLGP
jgi:hypothetical protein